MEATILTPNQHAVLESVAQDKYITDNFYLTGGTTLSEFYFKHRLSEDLDLFSEKDYDSKKIIIWVKKTAADLKIQKLEQQKLTGQEVFYLYFDKGKFVKVDFSYFPFPHLGEFTIYKNLKISSIEDIAVNKIQAIITRKRSRDYLDLYLCSKHLKWTPKDMQKSYRLKFDTYISYEQLATSFTNIVDSNDLPKFLGNTPWSEVKKYFLSQATSLKNMIIK